MNKPNGRKRKTKHASAAQRRDVEYDQKAVIEWRRANKQKSKSKNDDIESLK